MEGQASEEWPAVPGIPLSWSVYFPGDEFSADDDRVSLIRSLTDFLDTSKGTEILSEAVLESGFHYLPVDFGVLEQTSIGQEFHDALLFEPKDAISCLGASAYEVLFSSEKNGLSPQKINIRLHNYEESLLALKDLKAASIGKLVSVRGSVVRMSMVRPLVTQMDFTCGKCGALIDRRFVDGKFSPPAKCILDGCRSKSFNPDRSSASTIEFQKIRVQEILSPAGHEEGRMPRTVECELTEDLVDTCVPGDVVTVCGFVKVLNAAVDGGGGKVSSKDQSLFFLYLHAISVVNSKNQRSGGKQILDVKAGAPPNVHKFTSRDLEFVARFATENGDNLFRRLLHSVCPSIYGHEILKAGIILALFGGVQKHVTDKDRVPVRGDIHVLVVGDPGLGKSQILQAAAAIAPRGIYVCGNSTTSAGLTVAVVKDAITGDYVFEAGAMVLADRGVCCIDEFDKITCEHQALLEAMEQQSVSVAKAGLVASLASRTSVIAAANPVGGHYDRAKTVNENLKMGAAILSRFDLVFILLDNPNEQLDRHLSEHVMALHGGGANEATFSWKSLIGSTQRAETQLPLLKKLKLDKRVDCDFSPLPGPLLRKYIAYAKQYVFPRMSEAAADVLQKFYLRLRSERLEKPITARQLESLVRLAEARARLELRQEITEQDAIDVVEIMKDSLLDKFLDERGCVDFSRSGGMSQAKETKRFMSALQRRSEQRQKPTFTLAELYLLADEISLHVPDMDAFIEKVNDAGYLLKKGPRLYQVTG